MRRFIDVSVLLCVALKQPEEYYGGCKALLERLRAPGAGEKVYTTMLTPTVFHFILVGREGIQKSKIMEAISGLRALNMTIVPLTDGKLMERAAQLAEERNTDFDDAVNALVMQKRELKEIYSTDPDYDKFEWVERIVPEHPK